MLQNVAHICISPLRSHDRDQSFFFFFLFFLFFADCFLLDRSLLHCRITRDRVSCRKKSRKEGDEEGIEGKKEGGKLTLLTRDLGTLLYLLSFSPLIPSSLSPESPESGKGIANCCTCQR